MSVLFETVINDKSQLKNLSSAQLQLLCDDIRDFLIEHVSKTGGHLSSNLCTVELTVALHRIFNTPQDKIVFDVGHQCYTHKILTGRSAMFDSLRQPGGLSGFPNPFESEHDCFISGHGNTAISAAIGIARAKKLKQEEGTVIAVVGDGAFTGGMVYEGINNIDKLDNLIVVLNDNKMSISKNVGAVSRYLTRLRTSPEYHSAKHQTEHLLDHLPFVGQQIKTVLVTSKTLLRRALYDSTFFEQMGFQYIGPLDGHNIDELCAAYSSAKEYKKPLFIHAVTVKGKGFTPAEENPGAFHGVSAFNIAQVPDPDDTISDS
ncbi:MAG: 1-deoxy-D-xylulose-5-phosphate synthase N-terminal domain-containing protein, partial [Pygmaiobacter sp.]